MCKCEREGCWLSGGDGFSRSSCLSSVGALLTTATATTGTMSIWRAFFQLAPGKKVGKIQTSQFYNSIGI